ncbi:MAG: restriction endonuclease subunit S [Sulfurovum sp.]|nr:restriction endonuclease subunit S [Sulfurovum sp.]
MILEKYDSYKDSGLEWLGEIPIEWEVKRFGDNFKVNKNKNKELLCDNLLSLSFGKIIRKDIKSHFGLLPKNFNNYQIIEAGYIILRLMDLQNDKKSLRVGLVEEKGIITSAYIGIIINHFLDSKFIYYLLYSYDILKVFYWEGGSIRQSMGFNEIRILPLIFPMIKTQTKIATYLDTQTQKIDRKIQLLEEKSLKYKELKQTLINETVLRGLDKGVKLKDSGIEWIGDVPEHWEVKRLKDLGFIYSGLTGKSGDDFKQENNSLNRKYIPFTNIAKNKYINLEDMKNVLINKDEKQNKVKKRGFVFSYEFRRVRRYRKEFVTIRKM